MVINPCSTPKGECKEVQGGAACTEINVRSPSYALNGAKKMHNRPAKAAQDLGYKPKPGCVPKQNLEEILTNGTQAGVGCTCFRVYSPMSRVRVYSPSKLCALAADGAEGRRRLLKVQVLQSMRRV